MERLILVDCEAVGGGSWNLITEVFVAICTLSKATKQWMPSETYHSLVRIPIKHYDQIKRSSVCKYVYQNLTGLSLTRLYEHGRPFGTVFRVVNALFDKYPNTPIFARDPKLESTAFKRNDIQEVLYLLQMPYCCWYYYKHSRPPVSEHNICNHHFPVILNKKPHCARADVYNMLFWINTVGLHLLPLSAEKVVAPAPAPALLSPPLPLPPPPVQATPRPPVRLLLRSRRGGGGDDAGDAKNARVVFVPSSADVTLQPA